MRFSIRSPIVAILLVALLTAGIMRLLHVYHPIPIQDSVVGTLRAIDHQHQTITVETPMGSETLLISKAFLVHQGVRTLPEDELDSHAAERVKVWYRETDGRRVVTEVRLAAAHAVGGR